MLNQALNFRFLSKLPSIRSFLVFCAVVFFSNIIHSQKEILLTEYGESLPGKDLDQHRIYLLSDGTVVTISFQAKLRSVLVTKSEVSTLRIIDHKTIALDKGMDEFYDSRQVGDDIYIFFVEYKNERGRSCIWKRILKSATLELSGAEMIFEASEKIMKVPIAQNPKYTMFHSCYSSDSTYYMMFCRYADGLHGDDKRWQFGAVVISEYGDIHTWNFIEIPYTLRSSRIVMFSVDDSGNPLIGVAKAKEVDAANRELVKSDSTKLQRHGPPTRLPIIDEPETTFYNLVLVDQNNGLIIKNLGRSEKRIVSMACISTSGDSFRLFGVTSSVNNKRSDGYCCLDYPRDTVWKHFAFTESLIVSGRPKDDNLLVRLPGNPKFSELQIAVAKQMPEGDILLECFIPLSADFMTSYEDLIIIRLKQTGELVWNFRLVSVFTRLPPLIEYHNAFFIPRLSFYETSIASRNIWRDDKKNESGMIGIDRASGLGGSYFVEYFPNAVASGLTSDHAIIGISRHISEGKQESIRLCKTIL